jgi:4-amino-4-deoxy-L-arabinose transferase-like glycosyltransferase
MRVNLSPQQLLLTLLLLCFAALLRLGNLGNVTSRTPDERVYTSQANIWLQSGRIGLRSMVAQYEAVPEAQYYPPPTRVGMIRLVAVMMRWTGRNDESVGALIACAASVGSLFVLALIGVRFLPALAALLALLFYAVFPPELAIARRTWTDALVELASLLLVWLACEITRNSGRRVWYLLFVAIGSASIAIKESMVVPYGLCALWILWVLLKERGEWKNALLLVSAAALGLVASFGWIAGLVGSFSDLVRIVSGIPTANAGNPYAIEYASGPGYLLLQAFWILSPVTAILGVTGLYAAFIRREELGRNFRPVLLIVLFTLSHVVIAMLMPHWLNLRYVGVTFGPLCLLAGLGGWYVYSIFSSFLGSAQRRVFAGLAIAILIGGAVTDYRRFRRIFVRDATADLSVKMLRDERDR